MPPHLTDSCIKVGIVDEEPVSRLGIRSLLDTTAVFKTEFEVASVVQAEMETTEHDISLLIVEPDLDGGGGFSLINRVARNRKSIRCMVYMRNCTGGKVLAAVKAGAHAVVTRREPMEEVLLAAIAALAGYRHLSLEAANAVGNAPLSLLNGNRSPFCELPPRQAQVFRLLGKGLMPQSIAGRLGISLKTVQSHVERLKHRLNYQSQGELAYAATMALRDEP